MITANFRRSLGVFMMLVFFIGLHQVNAQNKPFQGEINQFLQADKVKAPEKGQILFIGSSSIKMWDNLGSYFPGRKVLNRGFGGSSLPHIIDHAEEIIFPYQPSQIVIYSGENDIAAGADANTTYKRFIEVFELIRSKMPKVPVLFISIKPSPSRHRFRPIIDSANAMIKDYLKTQRRASYVDVYTKMLDDNNYAKGEIFLSDSLHMNKEGYKIWQKEIAPHLKK